MKTTFRIVAWLLVAGIIVVTLGPPRLRPVTDMSQNFEHGMVFIGLGIAFGLGYPDRFLPLLLASAPALAVLELLQLWVPGRHARLSDFVVDLIATMAGLFIARGALWLASRMQKSYD